MKWGGKWEDAGEYGSVSGYYSKGWGWSQMITRAELMSVCRALGGGKVEVKVKPGGQWQTDGKVIEIPEYTSYMQSEVAIVAHEIGHCLYTDFGKGSDIEKKLFPYLNALEDCRVNDLIMKRYPGVKKYLQKKAEGASGETWQKASEGMRVAFCLAGSNQKGGTIDETMREDAAAVGFTKEQTGELLKHGGELVRRAIAARSTGAVRDLVLGSEYLRGLQMNEAEAEQAAKAALGEGKGKMRTIGEPQEKGDTPFYEMDSEERDAELEAIEADARQVARNAEKMVQYIRERKQSRLAGKSERGIVDARLLPRLYTEASGKVFARKVLPDSRADAALVVLVDMSGSMSDELGGVTRYRVALSAGRALHLAALRSGLPCALLGFTHGKEGRAVLHNGTQWDGEKVARVLRGAGDNDDATALEYACAMVDGLRGKRKMVIVLSDGQPTVSVKYPGRRGAGAALREEITKRRNLGYELYAVGIQYDVTSYYGREARQADTKETAIRETIRQLSRV